jgi:hypothetical protein
MPFIAGQLRTLTDHFTSVWLLQATVTLVLIASDHKTDTLHKRHQPRTCLRLCQMIQRQNQRQRRWFWRWIIWHNRRQVRGWWRLCRVSVL